jgi:photosystem II stability/assembly factor-like uncharacterized protein
MKTVIKISLCLLFVKQFCFAQWVQTNGPSGTDFTSIYDLAFSDNNVFAATSDTGVFRTTDNGNNWTPVNNGLPTTTYIQSINILGTDVFVTTGVGVFLSTDFGASWNPRNNGLPSTPIVCFVASGGNILIGTQGYGIYVSSNYGINWNASNNGLPVGSAISALTSSGSLLFACVWGIGVFISTDNGSNWIQRSSGLTNSYILCFAVCSSDVYAGTQGGVFLTTNNGDEWVQVNNGLTTTYILSFAVSGSNVMAGTFGGGVFITQDKGANWNAFNDGLIYSIIFSMTASDEYAFSGIAVNGGVWRRPLSDISDVIDESFPFEFKLKQNYPNPFNPSTVIGYQIPVSSNVTLKIYDVLGNEVATLVDEYKPAGKYEIEFNSHSGKGRNLTSGVFFYQLLVSALQSKDGKTEEFIQTKKMILMK